MAATFTSGTNFVYGNSGQEIYTNGVPSFYSVFGVGNTGVDPILIFSSEDQYGCYTNYNLPTYEEKF